MLVSKRALRAAQQQIVHLQGELERAQSALSKYKAQEGDLLDALVASRAEARQIRSDAEVKARELLASARAEADSAEAQAHALRDRVRAQAADAEVEARARVSEYESEIARLREVQRELNGSLQQAVAALNAFLPEADGARQAPAVESKALPAPLVAPAADQRQGEPSPPEPGIVLDRSTQAKPGANRFQPSVTTWGLGFRVVPRPKTAIVAGTAAVVIVAGVLAVPALWRASGGRTGASLETAVIPASAPTPEAPRPGERATQAHRMPPRSESGSAPADRPLKVALRTVRPVWLRADVDGKTSVARLLRAGEHLDLRGSRELVVRAGDAGAVVLSVNGRPQTPLGPDGAVLTRRIAAEPAGVAGATSSGRPVAASDGSSRLLAGDGLRRRPPEESAKATTPPLAPALHRTASAPPPGPPNSTEPATLPQPAAVIPESDVLRAHEAYFNALRTGDEAQMGRLVADGFRTSGAPAVDPLGLPYEISLRNASVEIRGVGAVVSGTGSQRITDADSGSARDQSLAFSEVWIKRDGQWQLMNVRFWSPGGTR